VHKHTQSVCGVCVLRAWRGEAARAGAHAAARVSAVMTRKMQKCKKGAHMMSTSARSAQECAAALASPVISTQLSPSAPKRADQSCSRSCTIACTQK
jgi:hypothetical protein